MYERGFDRDLLEVELTPAPDLWERVAEQHERTRARSLEWYRREAAKMRAMDEHERMMATDADYYREHRVKDDPMADTPAGRALAELTGH